MSKPGLYDNINKKRKRIEAGSGEKMRKVGSPGAPTAKAFKNQLKPRRRSHDHFWDSNIQPRVR